MWERAKDPNWASHNWIMFTNEFGVQFNVLESEFCHSWTSDENVNGCSQFSAPSSGVLAAAAVSVNMEPGPGLQRTDCLDMRVIGGGCPPGCLVVVTEAPWRLASQPAGQVTHTDANARALTSNKYLGSWVCERQTVWSLQHDCWTDFYELILMIRVHFTTAMKQMNMSVFIIINRLRSQNNKHLSLNDDKLLIISNNK